MQQNDWTGLEADRAQALTEQQDAAWRDEMVEQALFQRAIGYQYTETRTEKNGKDGEKTIVTQKHMPPDVHSMVMWLKNRQPMRWREKQEPLPDKEQEFQLKISVVEE